jgi:hypothetical protein
MRVRIARTTVKVMLLVTGYVPGKRASKFSIQRNIKSESV